MPAVILPASAYQTCPFEVTVCLGHDEARKWRVLSPPSASPITRVSSFELVHVLPTGIQKGGRGAVAGRCTIKREDELGTATIDAHDAEEWSGESVGMLFQNTRASLPERQRDIYLEPSQTWPRLINTQMPPPHTPTSRCVHLHFICHDLTLRASARRLGACSVPLELS
ncbi:hypothetical protein LX36DRAFT_651982 [Colletotrichum falcatum]|nr:hypothetical protein LX36DRAFT_651982 [Colletotrichum falcatum]